MRCRPIVLKALRKIFKFCSDMRNHRNSVEFTSLFGNLYDSLFKKDKKWLMSSK